MAAPTTNIKWGNVAGNDGGRIGIYKSLSSTASKTTVTIQVWFWSNYTVNDDKNTVYFNTGTTSASTVVKSNVDINHTDNTTGWGTSNQTKIYETSIEYDRTANDQVINCAAKFTGIDSSRLSGATMTVSDSYTIPKSITYTIKYNPNGGSGSMADTTVIYGVSTPTRENTFTRTGYTFIGWHAYRHSDKLWYCKKSDGTTGWYASGSIPSGWDYYLWSNGGSASKTTLVDGDTITLYAQWKIDTYTVSYNANGGSGAPSSQTKTYGVPLTLSTTKPTKSGYTFLGWNSSSTATGAQYAAGGSYTNNASVTLYAIWSKTLTLSYDANNGGGAPNSQAVTIYNSATYGTLTISNTKPTQTGYTFLGWSTNPNASSATYSPGENISISSNTVLYAIWKANTFTVKYNANGGSGTMADTHCTYGELTIIRDNTFTRPGYKFANWHGHRASDNTWRYTNGTESNWYTEGKQPNGYYKAVFVQGEGFITTTPVDGDVVTLYAIWESMNVGWKNVDGEWNKYSTYVKIDDEWVRYVTYYKDETGTWRQCII